MRCIARWVKLCFASKIRVTYPCQISLVLAATGPKLRHQAAEWLAALRIISKYRAQFPLIT